MHRINVHIKKKNTTFKKLELPRGLRLNLVFTY